MSKTVEAQRLRPIIFNTDMAAAIVKGRKTVTRRPVTIVTDRLKRYPRGQWWFTWDFNGVDGTWKYNIKDEKHGNIYTLNGWETCVVDRVKCPFGCYANRLYVRETTCIAPKHFAPPDDTCATDDDGDKRYVSYKANGHSEEAMRDYGLVWTPAMHVPRWACRTELEITGVRVTRLWDMTEDDAAAEGVQRREGEDEIPGFFMGSRHPIKGTPKCFPSALQAFQDIWDSLYGKGDFAWKHNPWVWEVHFGVVTTQRHLTNTINEVHESCST